MNNKGQTTVLFSLVISALFLFTLTALEVERIYMNRVKIRAVVHSTSSSIMADYNEELFERYHLLFMDPTYGTGSEAAAEEKIMDYLDASLNADSKMYQFIMEEIAVTNQKYMLDENMEQIKEQITEYEKTTGVIQKVMDLKEKLKEDTDIERAVNETERSAIVSPAETETEGQASETEKEGQAAETQSNLKTKETDPRDTLKKSIEFGILAFVLPDHADISKEGHDFNASPSKAYKENKDPDKDNSFQDIDFLKSFLKESAEKETYSGLQQNMAFISYVDSHFSNGVKEQEDSVLKCEMEYLLEGENNDYANLEAVIQELIWLRMPVNYVYLLSDEQKKSEAFTLAATICAATGTEALAEVVKYLLLGCWAYGETLYEMRLLLSSERIAYVKSKENWNTDLKTLSGTGSSDKVKNGMDYGDYLMLLFAKKGGKELDICYARMLDVIEKNLQKGDPDFCIGNCVGSMTIQGKICVNPLFVREREKSGYDHYFEEGFSYTEKK